jgi:hypothetical protein
MQYQSEQLLVSEFVSLLESHATPWGDVRISCEFDYSRGRTDVVLLDESGKLIAFEAKLSKWRYALHQAYRNTCFAHRSFVLLPIKAAVEAAKFRQEFESRGVGLCCLDKNTLTICHEAPSGWPIEPWLALAAIERIQQQA